MRSVELKEYDFGGIDRCPTDEEKMTFIINNLSENNLREKVMICSLNYVLL